MQPGRDYEAFFKASAWGGAENSTHSTDCGPDKSRKPNRTDEPHKTTKPDHVRPERTDRSSVKPEMVRKPDETKIRAENVDVDDSEGLLSQQPLVMFSPERKVPPSQNVKSECVHVTLHLWTLNVKYVVESANFEYIGICTLYNSMYHVYGMCSLSIQ